MKIAFIAGQNLPTPEPKYCSDSDVDRRAARQQLHDSAAFTPSGEQLVVIGSGMIQFYDTSDGTPLFQMPTAKKAELVGFAGDCPVTLENGRMFRIWCSGGFDLSILEQKARWKMWNGQVIPKREP
jgi:hypothetical protein